MKKPYPVFLMIASILIALNACKKDSNPSTNTKTTDNTSVNKSLIVGKWLNAQDTILGYTPGKPVEIISEHGPTTNSKNYEQFNSDGSAVFSNGTGALANFTYSINGNKITIIYPAQVITMPDGTSFNNPGETDIGTLKTLTSHNMEIFFDDADADGGRTTEAAYFVK